MTAGNTLLLLSLLAGGVEIMRGLRMEENPIDTSLVETESGAQKIPFQDSIWNYIDRNKDGFISIEDLKKSMHFSETADILMSIADKDHDHKLSKLEFFGTVEDGKFPKVKGKFRQTQTKGDKVKGDPGSGDLPWHDRDFDEFIDMKEGEKYPEMCSKEFWEWAAEEWEQRNTRENSNKAFKADNKDLYQGGMQEKHNPFPAYFGKEVLHENLYMNRGMSHLGTGNFYNPNNYWAGSPSSGFGSWDICLQILPIQKRLRMKKPDFDKWRMCYQKTLQGILDEEKSESWVHVLAGIPKTPVSRDKVVDFYKDYHIGDKTNCALTKGEIKKNDIRQKIRNGCYPHMPCWTNPDEWLPQANEIPEPNNKTYTSPIAVKRHAVNMEARDPEYNPVAFNPNTPGITWGDMNQVATQEQVADQTGNSAQTADDPDGDAQTQDQDGDGGDNGDGSEPQDGTEDEPDR